MGFSCDLDALKMNVDEWLRSTATNARSNMPAHGAGALGLQPTALKKTTDDTAFSEAQQLLRRVRLEDTLDGGVPTKQAPPPATKSRWQEVKHKTQHDGLSRVNALHVAENRMREGQQPPLSMDRVEKLVESLNKAREHSEQYARCRLELREVENENEPPVTSSFSKGTSAINAAINALKEKESGQILSTALSNSAADRAQDLQSSRIDSLLAGNAALQASSHGARARPFYGESQASSAVPGFPVQRSSSRTGCCTPQPEFPDAGTADTRKPLSPLDSPYYGKYMSEQGTDTAPNGDSIHMLKRDSQVRSTVLSMSAVQRPQAESETPLDGHHAPTLQCLKDGGHLRTPDAVEKVTAWLQPAEDVHEWDIGPSLHGLSVPSAHDTASLHQDREAAAVFRATAPGNAPDIGRLPSTRSQSAAAQGSDICQDKDVEACGEIEFCLTSSGFKVARALTRNTGGTRDQVSRNVGHSMHMNKHPPTQHPPRQRHHSVPLLTAELSRHNNAELAAAAQHRRSYLVGSCLNAWWTWTAGVHSRLLAAEQKLGCMMAASTARRALAAWRAHMVAAAHERAAEAEQLCKQRIQEARKTEIACQFHRVWHMHSVLKYWRATTQEIVATRTAAAHAALAEAALAARMEIAEKFRNNYQLHASMDTWRRAVPALKQERRASEQAQLVQSRIDAVLARVRAAKQSGKQLPWSDIPATQSEQHTAQPSAAELDIGSDAAPELSEGHPSLPTAPELHLTGSLEQNSGSPMNGGGPNPSVPNDRHNIPGQHQQIRAGKSTEASSMLQNPDIYPPDMPHTGPQQEPSRLDAIIPYPDVHMNTCIDSGVSGTDIVAEESYRSTDSASELQHAFRVSADGLHSSQWADPSAHSSQQHPSARDSSSAQLFSQDDEQLQQPATSVQEQPPQDHRESSQQVNSSNLQDWNSYIDYVNRQVIAGPHEHASTGTLASQGAQPPWSLGSTPKKQSSIPVKRNIAQHSKLKPDKKAQAELEAQLAQAEAAAEASRRKQEDAKRKQSAQILREELRVAREHDRISCLWRRGWRPWRLAVDIQKRKLRKFIKHRHTVMMRAALSVLARNALKAHMETVLVQVTGVVALRTRLATARQRWSFEAWHHFSCCMRWRHNRLSTCCWLSWHAQAVAGRLRLRKSRQYYRRVLLRRGMKAWTAFYTQVLDQRLLLESMAVDMAVLHSKSALLRRSFSKWRSEAQNSATERAHAERHQALWSKVHTWLAKPQPSPDTAPVEQAGREHVDALLQSTSNSKLLQLPGAHFLQLASSWGASDSRRESGAILAQIHNDQRDDQRHAAPCATPSAVQGNGGSHDLHPTSIRADTLAEELENILDEPPQFDVEKLIGYDQDREPSLTLRPPGAAFSRAEDAPPIHLDQIQLRAPLDWNLEGADTLKPPVFAAPAAPATSISSKTQFQLGKHDNKHLEPPDRSFRSSVPELRPPVQAGRAIEEEEHTGATTPEKAEHVSHSQEEAVPANEMEMSSEGGIQGPKENRGKSAGRGKTPSGAQAQQPTIRRAIHEKLARFVCRPNPNRAVLTKAVEKLHRFSKQPDFGANSSDNHPGTAMEASSIEATPLKPTLKAGRHAKLPKAKGPPKQHMAAAKKPLKSQPTSRSTAGIKPAAISSDSKGMRIHNAHQALTEGREIGTENVDDEDSDDEFAWIMHRLPRK